MYLFLEFMVHGQNFFLFIMNKKQQYYIKYMKCLDIGKRMNSSSCMLHNVISKILS